MYGLNLSSSRVLPFRIALTLPCRTIGIATFGRNLWRRRSSLSRNGFVLFIRLFEQLQGAPFCWWVWVFRHATFSFQAFFPLCLVASTMTPWAERKI